MGLGFGVKPKNQGLEYRIRGVPRTTRSVSASSSGCPCIWHAGFRSKEGPKSGFRSKERTPYNVARILPESQGQHLALKRKRLERCAGLVSES